MQPYSRKINILRYALNRIKKNNISDSTEKQKLFNKCKKYASSLSSVLGLKKLKLALGASLFAFLCAIHPASAQSGRGGFQFDTLQSNPFNIQIPVTRLLCLPAFADLDDDGDQDMIYTFLDVSTYNFGITFVKNFGTPTVPHFGNDTATIFQNNPLTDLLCFPSLADFDGDGDFDLVLGTNYYQGYYATYPAEVVYVPNTGNTGSPVFDFAGMMVNPGGFQLPPGTNDFLIPAIFDMDHDGDLDAVVSNVEDIYYYQNSGNSTGALFGSPQTLQGAFGGPASPIAQSTVAIGDMDEDGDPDIMINDAYNYQIKYYTNSGTLTSPVFNTGFPNVGNLDSDSTGITMNLVDIDGDGDLDMFYGAYYGIYFQLNITEHPSHIENTLANELNISPNPATDFITINGNINTFDNYQILDLSGKLISEGLFPGNKKIMVNQLPAGMYLLNLIASDGKHYHSMLNKQ